MNRRILNSIIPIILFLFVWQFSAAQGIGGGAERSDKDFSFLPLPYINYDRSIGFTAGLLPLAMYNLSKKDTISPSSISGGLGIYSSSKTWFAMLFNKFYLDEDRYRIMLAGGRGNINFQFYIDLPVSPGYIDYNTKLDFIKAEVQRKVVGDFYAGLNYTYIKMITLFGEAQIEQNVYLNGIGAVLSYDIRDNVYYPHKGSFSNLNYISFPEFLNSDFPSNKIEIDYNQFFEMKNKHDIIGIRAYGGFGIGELSFNQQFVVGNTDIRGYSQGKYRGEQTLALQGEYRWNPWKKIGLVGFAGVATIFSGINEDDNGKILPGIGTGFRYNVFPKNHLNIGMDVAVGLDDWGLYFKIGESF